MKRTSIYMTLLLLALGGAGITYAADKQDEAKKPPPQQAEQKVKQADKVQANGSGSHVPVYVPPLRGAPLSRVGGGTRGIDDNIPLVSVVTPEHTGYSSKAQPTLYWFLSEKHPARIEIALINDHDIDPVLETALSLEVDAGINGIDLAEFGVTLKPGVAYQWSVALVADAERRSGDIIASGRVQYAELSPEQKQELQNAAPGQAMAIYASGGYWYDLFNVLSDEIARQPANEALLRQRITLLEQVGLAEVAEFEQRRLND